LFETSREIHGSLVFNGRVKISMAFDSQTSVFLFPGQGSQFVGMGTELATIYPIAKQTFEEADEILGFALSKLAWEGPAEELDDTINTQPALMTHSVAALRILLNLHPGLTPAYVAGHSMGELSALMASGALSFSEALTLVRARGEAMKYADIVSPGGMAAIIGLDIPTLDEICTQASVPGEIVQVANDNCPGQVVISGADPALNRAIEIAQGSGARLTKRLPISIAAHSPLMGTAQGKFNIAVEKAPIKTPRLAIIGNVTARPLGSIEDIRTDLQAQLTSRVRWTESVQYMISKGVETFFEIGSGNVLTGLLKRIDRSVKGIPIGKPEDLHSIS
jgi:[acyl-carrier-protein] S-malonyltransferase